MSTKHRRTHGSSPFSRGDNAEQASPRQARLEHILKDEIQTILRDDAADPALGSVRVLSLQLSPDGGHARVAFAVEGPLGEADALIRSAAEALGRATPFVRARLAAQLDLKRVPKLSFTSVGVAPEEIEEGGEPWPR